MKKLFMTYITALMLFTTLTIAGDKQEVENFVSRFYTEVLGRTADTAGLEDWTNRLVSGESTGSDVAFGFVFSAEFTQSANFKDDGVFLTILYRAFFNRDADTGGLNGWLLELAGGTTKEAVLNGFLYSQEFANLCEAYGIKPVPDGSTPSSGGGVEDFVKRFYVEVLGREADAGGLADWVSRLNAGTATGADIATGFVFSSEFDEASKDDVTYLNVLYKAFFNRAADEGGLNGWLDQLEQGVSRLEVLNGFLHSQEFINLCEEYGIVAFVVETAPVDLATLIVGKTFYMVSNEGIIEILEFRADGKIYGKAVYDNGEEEEFIIGYSINGDVMTIIDPDGSTFNLTNFEVVDKGIGFYDELEGEESGFYFTYADAEADGYR